MIRVVGANPALDRVAMWPPIALGSVNRASEVVSIAGGKGLNVCHGVRDLGGRVAAYGFVGGTIGAAIRDGCREDGIEDRLTPIAGETRVCMIVVEPDAGRSTVLNEPGPTVSMAEADALLGALGDDLRAEDVLVICGTLPLGLPPALMARIVRLGREAGARVILDSSGATLRAGVGEQPWMVKCNAGEFAALQGESDPNGVAAAPDDPLALVGPAQDLLRAGISVVVVTLGADGLLAVNSDTVLRIRPPAVPAVNPVGSGDLLLAALAVLIVQGATLADALAFATACAAGSVGRLAPEIPAREEVERLLEGVAVEALVA